MAQCGDDSRTACRRLVVPTETTAHLARLSRQVPCGLHADSEDNPCFSSNGHNAMESGSGMSRGEAPGLTMQIHPSEDDVEPPVDSFPEAHEHRNSFAKTVGTITHYAKLIVAEDPIEEHKQYLESLEEQLVQERRETAKTRWQSATVSLICSKKMVTDAHALRNKKLSGGDKMAAAVRLEMALRDMEHPEKALLVRALQKRAENDYAGLGDRFMNEMFITGEKIFMWFTPAKTGHHKVLFTTSFGAAMFICFFFMCGEFASYMLRWRHSQYEGCLEKDSSVHGPRHLTSWISGSGQWCFHDINEWTFSSDFMLDWGARYAPLLGKSSNGHRWFTSMFIHQNFKHLFSNSLLFFSLAIQIEVKYGWWRICFLWLTSHMGGALFSAVLEDPCTAVVGASGGVFGLMGLFIADMVLNFRTIKRPIFRGLLITAFLLYFVFTGATIKHGTSHLSHLGGLVCGLFPAFLFLPKLKGERLEAWFPLLGGAVMLIVFITLPTYFYLSIVKNLNCDEGD